MKKKEKIRDLFYELLYDSRKQKKFFGCVTIILVAGILISYAFMFKEQTMPAERFDKEGMVEVFYAWFAKEESGENREIVYQVIRKDDKNYLYINGKEKGVCDYGDTSLAIKFDLSPDKSSNEALLMEDSDIGVGKNIYHLKKSQAEKYLKYLQVAKNYKLISYSATATIWDGYLEGENDIVRFMYIYKTINDGIMICAPVKETATRPQNIDTYDINILEE